MKLSEFKAALEQAETVRFFTTDGKAIPAHVHLTEAGLVTRNSLDCGGKEHKEFFAVFQLWVAGDKEHRLTSVKVNKILEKSGRFFDGMDPEVEIEFQGETIGRYGLSLIQGGFHLIALNTVCLRQTSPGDYSCCAPGAVCC